MTTGSQDRAAGDRVEVRELTSAIHQLGGAWFFADEVRAVGAAAGITDRFALYAAGRGGVLGDCDPAVVASAFAFFPADVVTARLREATAVMPPRECARVYADGLAAWGDARLGELDGMARLAVLGRRVVDSVRPMGLPLFTGWRAVPVPTTPGAAAALTLQVLRELRGDLHVHAVVAHELTPLEAILGKDGPQRARELRYPEPYPPLSGFVERRRAAEDLTDRLVAPAYGTLDAGERVELRLLVERARTVV